LVSLSQENGYIHLDEMDWSDRQLENGIIVKLKKVPFNVVRTDLFSDYLRAQLYSPTIKAFMPIPKAKVLGAKKRGIAPKKQRTQQA